MNLRLKDIESYSKLLILFEKEVDKMGGHLTYNAHHIENKRKYLNFIPKDVVSVLDIGCGRGEFMHLLKSNGYDVHGCDIDPTCISKSAPVGEVKYADVSKLSKYYSPDSFELITCMHVLEHTKCPYTTLEEIRTVTKKYALFAIPNARYTAWDERRTHLYSWGGDTFKNLLESSGLNVIKVTQDRTNIFPSVIRITPIINRLLLKIFIGPNELVALCKKE